MHVKEMVATVRRRRNAADKADDKPAADGDSVEVSHPWPLESLSSVRAKIYGSELDESAFSSIIADVVEGRYSDLHIAAFLTACAVR